MRKVIIFGCGGFVGKYLLNELTAFDYQVVGTDIIDGREEVKNQCCSFYTIDILNSNAVESVIEKENPDYIINLAAVSSVGKSWNAPQITMDVNVRGTLNILEAVRHHGIPARILLIGSSEEYAISDTRISEEYPINPNNPYGISKMAQEQFAKLYRKEYGMDIMVTRTFNHTGVGQSDTFVIPSFVRQVADIHKKGCDDVIKVGNLSVIRDFGDVRDMAAAYRMLLESNTEKTVFNVGSGNCYKLADILDYIISLTDVTIHVEVDAKKIRPLDNPIIWCDNALIKKEVGWEPQYTVYDAIKEMFDFYIS